jgi:restriction system protein
MDVQQLLWTTFSQFWWVAPPLLAIALFRLPAVKGWCGEQLVRLTLHWQLDRTRYVTLHDVTLQTFDGTTQIDHLVVSPFGVFVIETKNMKGWIFGSEKQAEWTQKIFRNTYRFQNPLRQNYKHVKAIEEMLQMSPDALHSIVVFVGAAKAKTPMPPNVFFTRGMTTYIKSFKQPLFTMQEVQEIFEALFVHAEPATRETHRKHVAGLKERNGRK